MHQKFNEALTPVIRLSHKYSLAYSLTGAQAPTRTYPRPHMNSKIGFVPGGPTQLCKYSLDCGSVRPCAQVLKQVLDSSTQRCASRGWGVGTGSNLNLPKHFLEMDEHRTQLLSPESSAPKLPLLGIGHQGKNFCWPCVSRVGP